MKNCEAIYKFVAIKYKHSGPEMAMAIKKIKKMIKVPEISEDTASRIWIFIWENKYKEAKRKETDLE